jgi:hypothetical protein
MFDNLIRDNLNELKKLDAAYSSREEFTEADAKKLDMLTCTLSRLMKSLPYIEEYGYDQDHSISGRRGRDSMGRYASMNMPPMMSGHGPMPPSQWGWDQRGYPPDSYWR